MSQFVRCTVDRAQQYRALPITLHPPFTPALPSLADTLIGNDLLRGVSGGEKKRVTIGEGIMTRARVLCLDEISTGCVPVDSS